MAVLMTEGFDMYNGVGANIGLQTKWTQNASGAMGVVSGRFGGQAMSITNFIGFPGDCYRIFNPAGNSLAMSCGFAYQAVSTLANPGIFACFETTGFGAQFSIGFTTAGALYCASGRGGTTLCTSANGIFIASTWVYIEVECVLNGSTGSINLYLNGALVASATGVNTLAAGGSGAGILRIISLTNIGGGATTQYVDDLYVANTATRLGECRVETLRPAGDSTAAWTPNSGANNYSRVNETTVDGDTSYVQTASTGVRDLYAIASLSSTPTTIFAVNVISFAEKTDATTRQLYNSVRSVTTDSDGAATNLAASYNRIDRLIQTDPATLAAWTASGVNNLLIGPKAA